MSLAKHLSKAKLLPAAAAKYSTKTVSMAYKVYEAKSAPNRPPIIIMHGLLGCKNNWHTPAMQLQEQTSLGRKIICVDARNHGESPHAPTHTFEDMAEDLKFFLDNLNIEKSVHLGHSMGARTMMYFALKYPRYVEKLVIVDTSPIFTSGNLKVVEPLLEIMNTLELPKSGTQANVRKMVDEKFAQLTDDQKFRAFLLLNLIANKDKGFVWRANIPVILAHLVPHMFRFPKVDNLKYEGPVLFILGEKSDFVPNEDIAPIRKMFPSVRFATVAGATHYVHRDNPRDFLKALLDFLTIPAAKLAHKFSTKYAQTAKKEAPVVMSYASYESTAPQAGAPPPPVMILHGCMGSKTNWNSLAKALHNKTSPKRKIICVDARNHGDSPHAFSHTYADLAADVKAMMEHFNIQKCCMIGHSMGGRAMMYFALKYPALTEKLIVVDISPVSTSISFKAVGKVLLTMQKVKLPTSGSLSTAKRFADMQLSSTINDASFRSFLLTNIVQKTNGSYAWRVNIPTILAYFSEHILSFPDTTGLVYNGPTIFIAGGKSDFIQKTDHPQILKIFPKAQFQEIEGAGHWLHSEKPTEFLQICLEFLNKNVIESS